MSLGFKYEWVSCASLYLSLSPSISFDHSFSLLWAPNSTSFHTTEHRNSFALTVYHFILVDWLHQSWGLERRKLNFLQNKHTHNAPDWIFQLHAAFLIMLAYKLPLRMRIKWMFWRIFFLLLEFHSMALQVLPVYANQVFFVWKGMWSHWHFKRFS